MRLIFVSFHFLIEARHISGVDLFSERLSMKLRKNQIKKQQQSSCLTSIDLRFELKFFAGVMYCGTPF